MGESILNTVKNHLGLAVDYTVFDHNVIGFINAAFSILHQLGVGPDEGFFIEDDTATWNEFILVDGSDPSKNLVKTYVYLKTRMDFDPPTTSFHLDAMNNQIQQYEWRLNVAREEALYPLEATS